MNLKNRTLSTEIEYYQEIRNIKKIILFTLYIYIYIYIYIERERESEQNDLTKRIISFIVLNFCFQLVPTLDHCQEKKDLKKKVFFIKF